MRAHGKPAGCVVSSESLCSPQELRGTEFFNDFLAWNNVAYGTFGLVEKNGSHLASLSIYRDSSSKEFEVAALDTLNFLVPHMQRAFKLHFQFSELRARAERTETALDMLSTGVIFLGDKGEVVLMNRSADELLRRKGGLRLEHRKLITSLCSESAALQSMIAAAAQTGSGKGLSAGGTLLITREQGRPLSVAVAPLPTIITALEKKPAAVLFISDPDQNLELPVGLLQRCYGLTAAEARLAILLVEGRALNEAAAICGVTRNTAKSQLRSIFSKTQVRRQGELIKVLLAGHGQIWRSSLASDPIRR